MEVKQKDTGVAIYKLDSASIQNSIKLNVSGLFRSTDYSVTVLVSSKMDNTNSLTKTIQVLKKFKTSYELSNSPNWMVVPGGCGTPCQFDYNRDGMDDIIKFEGYDLSVRYNWPGPVFYKGTKGGLIQNFPVLSNKKIFGGKMLIGDFDNNGYHDVLVVSGMDGYPGMELDGRAGKWEPILPSHIMFNNEGTSFNVKSLTLWEGIWRTASAADIDNDEDLDIVMFSSHLEEGLSNKILINDGMGNFKAIPSDLDYIAWADRCELIDMNRDGYPDLVIDDVVNENGYANRLRILWNDGTGNFKQTNSVRIPIPNDMFVLDIDAYDFDNDGFKEIVLPMNYITGDWKIFIFKTTDNLNFQNITPEIIQNNSFSTSQICIWNEPISIADIDNNGFIDIFLNNRGVNARWEWNGSKFIKK